MRTGRGGTQPNRSWWMLEGPRTETDGITGQWKRERMCSWKISPGFTCCRRGEKNWVVGGGRKAPVGVGSNGSRLISGGLQPAPPEAATGAAPSPALSPAPSPEPIPPSVSVNHFTKKFRF